MIKFLKNQDIQVTNFSIAKEKIANTFLPELLLANDDNYNFPLVLIIEDTNYNFNAPNTGSFSTLTDLCNLNVTSSNTFLASNFNPENIPDFQQGIKLSNNYVFYPTDSQFYNASENPVNSDGTYQGQVYNTIKNMYYNNYNNAYEQFGFDGYNTNRAKLNLEDKFISYTLNVTQSGDRIRPLSIEIFNQTGDIVANIYDDGLNNLYLSGSYFVNTFEFFTKNTDNVINYGETGLGKYLYYGLPPI